MIIRYHKSNPKFRDKILQKGLIPQIGDSYQLHHEGKKLTPCIFLYDKSKAEYDSTYDDDIWEVRLDNTHNWIPDLDNGMFEFCGAIMCFTTIPVKDLNLIYKGTGESY